MTESSRHVVDAIKLRDAVDASLTCEQVSENWIRAVWWKGYLKGLFPLGGKILSVSVSDGIVVHSINLKLSRILGCYSKMETFFDMFDQGFYDDPDHARLPVCLDGARHMVPRDARLDVERHGKFVWRERSVESEAVFKNPAFREDEREMFSELQYFTRNQLRNYHYHHWISLVRFFSRQRLKLPSFVFYWWYGRLQAHLDGRCLSVADFEQLAGLVKKQGYGEGLYGLHEEILPGSPCVSPWMETHVG